MRTTRHAIPFRSYKPDKNNKKVYASANTKINVMKAKLALIM